MSDETTLLPCPFCGSDDVERIGFDALFKKRPHIKCHGCGADVYDVPNVSPIWHKHDSMVQTWNTRATHGTLTADDVRDLIERHSDASGGNGRDFHNGAYAAIADELNAKLKNERHAYEQRITGDGSDWGEIMRDAYDDLMAAASESCTSDELADLEAHILGRWTDER